MSCRCNNEVRKHSGPEVSGRFSMPQQQPGSARRHRLVLILVTLYAVLAFARVLYAQLSTGPSTTIRRSPLTWVCTMW
jgi:hypothetical protein